MYRPALVGIDSTLITSCSQASATYSYLDSKSGSPSSSHGVTRLLNALGSSSRHLHIVPTTVQSSKSVALLPLVLFYRHLPQRTAPLAELRSLSAPSNLEERRASIRERIPSTADPPTLTHTRAQRLDFTPLLHIRCVRFDGGAVRVIAWL